MQYEKYISIYHVGVLFRLHFLIGFSYRFDRKMLFNEGGLITYSDEYVLTFTSRENGIKPAKRGL